MTRKIAVRCTPIRAKCHSTLVGLLTLLLANSSADAASYRLTDGTIVDPIQLRNLPGDHPYSGPDLESGVESPGAELESAALDLADLAGANLDGANLELALLMRGGSLRCELDRCDSGPRCS